VTDIGSFDCADFPLSREIRFAQDDRIAGSAWILRFAQDDKIAGCAWILLFAQDDKKEEIGVSMSDEKRKGAGAAMEVTGENTVDRRIFTSVLT
jgi:hypothetical protein